MLKQKHSFLNLECLLGNRGYNGTKSDDYQGAADSKVQNKESKPLQDLWKAQGLFTEI